jgi:hypothetical protein
VFFASYLVFAATTWFVYLRAGGFAGEKRSALAAAAA